MHKPRGLMELVYLPIRTFSWCLCNGKLVRRLIYIYIYTYHTWILCWWVRAVWSSSFFFPNHPLYNTSDECVKSRGPGEYQDTECHPLDIHRDQDLKTPKPPPGWFHDFKSEMVLIFVKIALLLVSVPKVLLEISGILLKSLVWRDFSVGCFRKNVIQPVDTFAPTSHQIFTSSSHIPMFSKM